MVDQATRSGMEWVHDLVDRYTAPSGRYAYRECRHCGQTLETIPAECPSCKSREFSSYALP